MELLAYLALSFFFGYAIGKIKGSDEAFEDWNKYIDDHTIYNPMAVARCSCVL